MPATNVMNPANGFLGCGRAPTAETLVRAYADYLLCEAGAYQLPVNLGRVFQHFGLPDPHRATLPGQRGATGKGLHVLLNAADRPTVQRFTAAHELMEMLIFAVKEGHADEWMDDRLFRDMCKRKERLCDIGAAELVMPLDLFRREVPQPAVMQWIQELAARCEVSLTAAIWRVLETDLVAAVLIVWHHAHKPREFVPSAVGQMNLFGTPEDADPPKKLRVLRVFAPPSSDLYIPTHKSITAQSTIQRSFEEGLPLSGIDELDLPGLTGRYWVESFPVTVAGERRVMSLIHLDEPPDEYVWEWPEELI